MHLLIILALILLIFYFLTTRSPDKKSTPEPQADRTPSIEPIVNFTSKLAYISKGKLFYRAEDGTISQIHSPYVQEMMDRVERRKQLHGWKEGTAFGTSFTGQTQQSISEQISIQVTSAQFVGPNKILYFLVDESFGGLFEYDINTQQETRLLHQQRLHYLDLEANRDSTHILCSQNASTGVANIAMLKMDGSERREMTSGDTVDSSPAWIPESPNRILFQSLGLARNPAGYVIAYGPASIQMLNIDDGELTAVLEDDNFDYLCPKVSRDGTLHFIRRPYETPKYSTSNVMSDFLLFPFRLLRAVFHYLNFFSLMYSRKPLTSASGPQVMADLKDIILKGKRIDAENALKKETPVNGVPSLVPRSWELVCRSKNGREKILATNVAAFNLTFDDEVVYSNGYGVFLLSNNGNQTILKDKLIADVIVS